MKALVQYNDFIGSSAADISDHTDLNKFIATRGVDTDRYLAVGARFYSNYSHGFSASIICIDKEQSTEKKKHIVKLSFGKKIDRTEFFELFKRFEVIITNKDSGYIDQDIDEEVTMNDKSLKK